MTVAPYNHQSLQAEHGIKTLSQILTKHLSGQGQMWHRYLPLATFAHNTFNSPNLANHSPYEAKQFFFIRLTFCLLYYLQ